MHRSFRLTMAMALAGAAVVLSATSAFAHEQRQVGAYQFTVGWLNEPTYVDAQNAAVVIIKDAQGNLLDDLGDQGKLQVTVSTGNQTSAPLDMAASFDPDSGLGTHGEFLANIMPTQPGDYTFHVTGTIKGQKVDEKFTSGPKTFNTVDEPTATQFPVKDPSIGQLSGLTNRLSSRADTGISAAKSKADSASSTATTGVILGIIGIIVGVGLGGGGLIAARRARTKTDNRPSPQSKQQAEEQAVSP
jgi:hypothetical protein